MFDYESKESILINFCDLYVHEKIRSPRPVCTFVETLEAIRGRSPGGARDSRHKRFVHFH
jgi:hypothetical protein